MLPFHSLFINGFCITSVNTTRFNIFEDIFLSMGLFREVYNKRHLTQIHQAGSKEQAQERYRVYMACSRNKPSESAEED